MSESPKNINEEILKESIHLRRIESLLTGKSTVDNTLIVIIHDRLRQLNKLIDYSPLHRDNRPKLQIVK